MCWIHIKYSDVDVSLSGWINIARTTGDVRTGDPCGNPTFTGQNANTWVGMCSNEECLAATSGENSLVAIHSLQELMTSCTL